MLRSVAAGFRVATRASSVRARSTVAVRHYTSSGLATAQRALSELGLQKENPGVYHGRWGGSGPVVESLNPATGEVLGRVVTVRIRSKSRERDHTR